MSTSNNNEKNLKDNRLTSNGNPKVEKKMQDSNDQIQYNRLAQDWRQIHNVIWGIPSVAVSIFTGVIVAAYGLQGWQRIIVLGLGSVFLFAMTVEIVKKSVTMDRMYKRIRRLEKEYPMKFMAFPSEEDEPDEEDNLKGQISNSPLHRLFKTSNARTCLVYVCFVAAVAGSILTYWEFIKNLNFQWWAYWVGISPVVIISFSIALVRSGIYEKIKGKI